MNQKSKRFIQANFPLLFILFIDAMGMGILFPILAIAFMNPSAHFFLGHPSMELRTFEYGAVISVFMLCWFFGAGVLGEYSDLKGRKHCLSICLAGAAVGYLFSGLALYWHSLSLLFLGRLVAGFTAGSQSIAQAAIVDASSEDDLSHNMGFMSLATCLGFVAGPIIGGVFSDRHLVAWFSLALPMMLAAALALLNLYLLRRLFNETFVPGAAAQLKAAQFNLWIGVKQFIEAFKLKDLRFLCVIFFVFIAGWSSYYSFISLYLVANFHYDALMTAMFSVFLGLGFCLGSGGLNTLLVKFFSAKQISAVGLLIAAVGCFLTAFSNSQALLWIIAFLIGSSVAVIYPNLVTLFAGQVAADQQGWVMGVNGSIMALSYGATTLGAGWLTHLYQQLPLVVAGAGMCLAAGLLLLMRPKTRSSG